MKRAEVRHFRLSPDVADPYGHREIFFKNSRWPRQAETLGGIARRFSS